MPLRPRWRCPGVAHCSLRGAVPGSPPPWALGVDEEAGNGGSVVSTCPHHTLPRPLLRITGLVGTLAKGQGGGSVSLLTTCKALCSGPLELGAWSGVPQPSRNLRPRGLLPALCKADAGDPRRAPRPPTPCPWTLGAGGARERCPDAWRTVGSLCAAWWSWFPSGALTLAVTSRPPSLGRRLFIKPLSCSQHPVPPPRVRGHWCRLELLCPQAC